MQDFYDDRPPMSGFAREIFEMAIDMHTPEPQVPIDLKRDLELSVQLDVVALALARCAWVMVGAGDPEPRWAEFSPQLRERYRMLAERAIQTIDPQVRLDAKDAAAKGTAAMIEGQSDMAFNAATWALIAHEAISRYESLLASLRLTGSGE